jgi:hypothetical protein
VQSTKWWVTFISRMNMQSRKFKKKENRFDIFLGSLSLWNLRKLKLDNQALLLAAWFLRGFPKRNWKAKYLIYRSLVVMVHNPLSPHKKSNAPFRGIFCWDCLQSLLCKGRTTKNDKGKARQLIFYVTPTFGIIA